MGRRTYGAAPLTDPVSAGSGQPNNHDNRKKVKIAAASGAALVLVIAGIAVGSSLSGKSQPEKTIVSVDSCVTGFIDSLDESDNTAMLNYLHPSLRDDISALDKLNIAELRRIEHDFDMTLSDISIVGSSDFSDSISVLEEGIISAYGVEIEITDARKVEATATSSYEVDGEIYSSPVDFEFVCINDGTDWYIYSGDYSEIDADSVSMQNDSPVGNVHIGNTNDETSDIVYKNTLSPDYYDEAAADLKAGHVMIEGEQYVFPVSLFNLKDVISPVLEETSETLMPRHEYIDMPFKFIDHNYDPGSMRITVKNISDSTESLVGNDRNGIITSLYVGVAPGEAYPNVYLPGNITLGCTYSEIASMYGRPDNYSETEQLIWHDSCIAVYQYSLQNSNNRLYLEFDQNSQLIAFQYYLADLTGNPAVERTNSVLTTESAQTDTVSDVPDAADETDSSVSG